MFPIGLLNILVGLILVGLLLWAISQIPMDPVIARIIRVVVIVLVVIWLLYFIVGGIPGAHPLFR